MPGSSPGERWAHHSSRSEIFDSEKRESAGEKKPALRQRGAEEKAKRGAKEEAKRAAEEKLKRETEEKAGGARSL